jgi:hypothetical protein
MRMRRRIRKKTLLTRNWELLKGTPFIRVFITEEDRNFWLIRT